METATQPAEMCQMPKPTKEHEWLQKFVGEWESEAEITMDPTQPPMVGKGSESTRMIGGSWIIAQGMSEMMGMPFESVLTLGFDPRKNKYVGTWVDSMSGYLWLYEGEVDAAGTTLSLDTRGPGPDNPDGLTSFKEVTVFKSPDHRVFTSTMQAADGSWKTCVTVHSRRKK
jgi:hypothetical protein